MTCFSEAITANLVGWRGYCDENDIYMQCDLSGRQLGVHESRPIGIVACMCFRAHTSGPHSGISTHKQTQSMLALLCSIRCRKLFAHWTLPENSMITPAHGCPIQSLETGTFSTMTATCNHTRNSILKHGESSFAACLYVAFCPHTFICRDSIVICEDLKKDPTVRLGGKSMAR